MDFFLFEQDRHYDFSYQVYRILPKEVTVLPGDELIVECEFETTKNDTFIYGGILLEIHT